MEEAARRPGSLTRDGVRDETGNEIAVIVVGGGAPYYVAGTDSPAGAADLVPAVTGDDDVQVK